MNNETVVEVEKVTYTKDRFEHNAFIFFHLAQFLFYLGWLTTAKIMLNPFGEDPGELFLALLYYTESLKQACLRLGEWPAQMFG